MEMKVSPSALQALLLARKGSGKLFSSLGVPQGLVLGPSQTSYCPGAMFFPQGVVEQTDRQSIQGSRHSQPAHKSPEIHFSEKGA